MTSNSDSITKYSCLIFLTVQNAAVNLTLRYSRTQPGPKYLTSSAVLLSEILKCLFSLGMYTLYAVKRKRTLSEKEHAVGGDENQPSPFRPLLPLSKKEVWAFIPITVPAFLYSLQNNLQYIAISNLDAATFQVAMQGKVLTTAVCAMAFLGKRLNPTQIGSILLLTVGIACASLPSKSAASTKPTPDQNHFTGLVSVFCACVVSGFAGVYTEMILKATQRKGSDDNEASMLFWHRNYQLALASIFFAFVGCFVVDREQVLEVGFLYGFNLLVWFVIAQQVMGGIAVALVIMYADNILKSFATSISLIISTVVSVGMWHVQMPTTFFMGAFAVLVATPVYGHADRREAKAPEPIQDESEVPLVEDSDIEKGYKP